MKIIWIILLFALTAPVALGQKVKVGFDKAADFTKYHTFSWSKAADAPEMTFKRSFVMGEIEEALKSKGVVKVEEGGNLILSGFGGFGAEIGGETMTPAVVPTIRYSTMWVGASVSPGSLVSKGTLVLDMVDPAAGGIVWQGVVTQNLDQNNRTKALKQMNAAIVKLIDKYPPKK